MIRTLWGVDVPTSSSQWVTFFQNEVLSKGFDGVETCAGPFFSFSSDPHALRPAMAEALLKFPNKHSIRAEPANQMDLVLQVHTCGYPVVSPSVEEHVQSLVTQVQAHSFLEPTLFNVHAGKDSFTVDDAVTFFENTLAQLQQQQESRGSSCGNSNAALSNVVFETHRQRILHSPFRLLEIQQRLSFPLPLNADLSHFIVMLERIPNNESDAEWWPKVWQLLLQQTRYIHARVGAPQQIQIADPTEAMQQPLVEDYLKWWREIVRHQKNVQPNRPMYMCPEFGPAPYLPMKQQVPEDVGSVTTVGPALAEVVGKFNDRLRSLEW